MVRHDFFKTLLFVRTLMLWSTISYSQEDSSIHFLQKHVEFIAHFDQEGRFTGSQGELQTAVYLEHQLQQIGAKPIACAYIRPFSFPLPKKIASQPSRDSLTGLNVVGYLDFQKKKTFLIGAHYDHLGRNEFSNARFPEKTGEIHPGADDNASGVSTVLLISQWIAEHSEVHEANYIIAFFSGEELGLQGSNSLVQELKKMGITIDLMLNFDMVGRLNSDRKLLIEGSASGDILDAILEQFNQDAKFSLILHPSGVGSSDYTPFYLDSIPVIGFSTGSHDDYHTTEDTSEKINYIGMNEVSRFSYSLLQQFEKENITYQSTPIKTVRSRSSLNVSLGIMPGYGSSESGLLIEAVIDDGPAKLAGLMRGDLILAIDECIVNDIHDYMNCLSNFEKGDTSHLSIQRNNEILIQIIKF